VAAIGLGWWGGVLVSAAQRTGDIEVASCFARSLESREAFAAEHGCKAAGSLDEILADPDIDGLLIATPHSTHRDLIEAASDAGKHLFVEKPLALTVDEAQACIAAAERGGVVLQVGHHRRRSAANRRLRGFVDEGALGIVHLLEATMHVPKYQNPPASWRSDPSESPAGGMAALGVHMVDTFQYLAGPIARVTAYSTRILKRWELDDVTAAVFELESGPLAYLGTSLVLPRRCDVAIYGTELAAWSVEDGKRLLTQSKDEATRQETPIEPVDEVVEQLREFAACVRGEGSPETGGPEALSVVAVFQALVESTHSGRSIDVAPYLPA
jgi:predicted dehydrogenase